MTYIIPYRETPKQKELRLSPAKFKVAVWGRRSGKSTFALNYAIRLCLEKPNSKCWIVTPTFNQAKDIYWRGGEMLNKYLAPWMYNRKNDSELFVEFKNGSILQFKGADRPETMRGSGLDLIVEDEVSEHRYAKETWETILAPSLIDRSGKAIFIGTPKGENFFKELYDRAKTDSNWQSWQIPTWESGAPWTLTEEGKAELERERLTKTEDWFMQEYGAEFRKFTGLVFKEFDQKIHVENFLPDLKYAMKLGMDFGWTNPTTCLFTYFDGDGVWYIFDEYYDTEKPIKEHAGRLLAKRAVYHNYLDFVLGDSASPQSIQEFGMYQWYITPAIKAHDSILNGINRIQERLKVDPRTNKPRLIIHPRCSKTIEEFERYRWKQQRVEGLNLKDEPEDADDHCIDALRYIINYQKVESSQKRTLPGSVAKTYKPIRNI